MINIIGAMLEDIRDHLKKWSGWILFTVLIVYYEMIFREMNFDMKAGNVILILAFAIVAGGVCGVLTGLFPVIINKVIATILILTTGILFTAQYIYHSVFNNYLSLAGTIRFGNQAADNADTVWSNIKENLPDVLLLIIPAFLAVICIWTFMSLERRKWWVNIVSFLVVAVLYITIIFVIWAMDSDVYSTYNVYKHYTSVDLAVEKLGVLESFMVDMREGMKSKGFTKDKIQFASSTYLDIENTESAVQGSVNEDIPVRETDNPPDASTTEGAVVIDTSPNTLNLDFDALNEMVGSDAAASLSEYFQNISPTRKNKYTGMFKGYNVIWITAEGYTGYALESGLFPVLSRLTYDGFVFDNYYQPLWYGSTLGGEYANLMGSPTKNGAYLSMCRAADNENGMIFSMGNMLSRHGYNCYAFHDNDYTYYDRNITHPALGYEWIASGNGLEYQTDDNGQDIWPQSDLVMLDDTFDKYTEDEPFHLYYLTVSGHVPYGYGAANAMAEKNRAVTDDLNYSDTTKAYLASQYELELMLESLVDKLESRNLLDSTVIVIAGDHVPYDNMEVIDELAGARFGDSLEAYKSNLVIWSGSMEESVQVDKVCSSIDILPTMLNLMGEDYDSRLIIGRDILSDSGGLVLFPDRSFITDDYEYNAVTDTVWAHNSSVLTDEDLRSMRLYVSDKFTAADNITETGYYTYVARYLGWNQDTEKAED